MKKPNLEQMFKEMLDLGKNKNNSELLDIYARYSRLYYQEKNRVEQINNMYELAIQKFGVELQVIMCIEEMSELIKELTKLIRYDFSFTNIDNLIDEIVDTEIMITQLKLILHKNCCNSKKFLKFRKQMKLNRLKERLQNE